MDDVSDVFHALAHEHRRQIIRALAVQPRSISELADQRGLSLPAIHKHLQVLEDAGLIRRRKYGRTHVVTLQRAPLQRVREWVGQFHPDWGSDDETLANYAEHLQRRHTAPEVPP